MNPSLITPNQLLSLRNRLLRIFVVTTNVAGSITIVAILFSTIVPISITTVAILLNKSVFCIEIVTFVVVATIATIAIFVVTTVIFTFPCSHVIDFAYFSFTRSSSFTKFQFRLSRNILARYKRALI